MKKLVYLILLPFVVFSGANDPCFSINEFMTQTEGLNSSITKNFVGGWNMFGYPCPQPIDVVEAFSSIEEKILS